MLIDKIKIQNRPSGNAVFAAIVLISIIALYNWFLQPHFTNLALAQNYGQIAEKLQEKNNKKQYLLTRKEDRLEILKTDLDKIQRKVFASPQVEWFMNNLQFMIEDLGCRMQSMKVSKFNTSVDYLSKHRAIIDIEGAYNSIVSLIEYVQTRPQQIMISGIDIISNTQNPSQLSCEMQITFFVLDEKKESKNE